MEELDTMKSEEQKQEELKKQKETEHEERLDSIRERQEERQRKQAEWIRSMKLIPKPLFQKMEEEYRENVVLPQINSDKDYLNQLKETMSHPIDRNEMQKHLMEYKAAQKTIELKHTEQIKAHPQASHLI